MSIGVEVKTLLVSVKSETPVLPNSRMERTFNFDTTLEIELQEQHRGSVVVAGRAPAVVVGVAPPIKVRSH